MRTLVLLIITVRESTAESNARLNIYVEAERNAQLLYVADDPRELD